MARKNANKNNNQNSFASIPDYTKVTICGIVAGFYGEGKKYDYVTVDVRHNYDEYYDRYKVAVNKAYEVPEDGEPITLECTMKSYKGDITFKEINADTQ